MTLVAAAHLASRQGLAHAQDIKVVRHAIVADEPQARGGDDLGPPPFGLVLSGLAACTSITLQMYAGRKQWTLGQVRVELRLSDDAGAMQVERRIRFEAPLSDEQLARLLEIADKTPVTRALKAGFTIETRFER